MRMFTTSVAALLLVGCADSHELIRDQAPSTLRLAPSDSLYIAVPEDAAYGADNYKGSGQNLAQIIYAAFAKRTHSVAVGHAAQSFDDALAKARAEQRKYLVYPTILHWE